MGIRQEVFKEAGPRDGWASRGHPSNTPKDSPYDTRFGNSWKLGLERVGGGWAADSTKAVGERDGTMEGGDWAFLELPVALLMTSPKAGWREATGAGWPQSIKGPPLPLGL